MRLKAIFKVGARLFGSLMVSFKSFLLYKPLKSHSAFYSIYLKECRIFIHSCLSQKSMSGDHEVEILCLLDSEGHQKTSFLLGKCCLWTQSHGKYTTLSSLNSCPRSFFFLSLEMATVPSEKSCSVFCGQCQKCSETEHPTEGTLKQI